MFWCRETSDFTPFPEGSIYSRFALDPAGLFSIRGASSSLLLCAAVLPRHLRWAIQPLPRHQNSLLAVTTSPGNHIIPHIKLVHCLLHLGPPTGPAKHPLCSWSPGSVLKWGHIPQWNHLNSWHCIFWVSLYQESPIYSSSIGWITDISKSQREEKHFAKLCNRSSKIVYYHLVVLFWRPKTLKSF